MSNGLYQAVSVEEMQAGTPVQFVGVHPLLWHEHPDQPTMGFVEHTPDPQATQDAALGKAVRSICIQSRYTPENLRTLPHWLLTGLAAAIAAALEQEAANG